MKKFLSVLLMVAGLMSCGDDDKPFIPELNKLTSVTCTKNGNAFFNANITYDQDKQINRIILNTEGNQFTDNYIIVDKTISVSGVKMIDGSLFILLLHKTNDFRKWREDDRWFSD